MATENFNDFDLLERIKNGNHSAFSHLVKKYTTQYYHLAYRYVGNQETAEDIVQTAFLKLWEKPHQWNPKKGALFTTWFYRIVVNLCLDHLKKKKAFPIPDHFDIADETDNQELGLMKTHDQKMLVAAIGQLPKRQKTALILCFYQDVSRQQAADIMKISLKALESLIMRAKKNLQTHLIRQGSVA